MRTTIDLPDELFRQVKIRAAQDGLRLKELIRRYIEQGLSHSAPPSGQAPRQQRSELLVARARVAPTPAGLLYYGTEADC